VLAGALAAALAGAVMGADARPAAAHVGQTLGPRMDFDLAAHLPPASSPQLAEQSAPPREG